MTSKLSEYAASEVKRLAEKAAPYRISITEDLGKKLRFLRQSFVFHFVKNIDKKKDKEQYIETKIAQERIFRMINAYLDPSGEEKLEKILKDVSLAAQYLRYIDKTEKLDSILASSGMTINTRSLENEYEDLADPETKSNIVKIFNSSLKVQSEIFSNLDKIKNDIFTELDEGIRYDAKTNKSGIKSNEFDRLTALEAMKQKSEEAAEKKLDSIKDSTLNAIDSKLNVQLVAQTIVE